MLPPLLADFISIFAAAADLFFADAAADFSADVPAPSSYFRRRFTPRCLPLPIFAGFDFSRRRHVTPLSFCRRFAAFLRRRCSTFLPPMICCFSRQASRHFSRHQPLIFAHAVSCRYCCRYIISRRRLMPPLFDAFRAAAAYAATPPRPLIVPILRSINIFAICRPTPPPLMPFCRLIRYFHAAAIRRLFAFQRSPSLFHACHCAAAFAPMPPPLCRRAIRCLIRRCSSPPDIAAAGFRFTACRAAAARREISAAVCRFVAIYSRRRAAAAAHAAVTHAALSRRLPVLPRFSRHAPVSPPVPPMPVFAAVSPFR